MEDSKMLNLHIQLKMNDPLTLFQCTRSSDLRIVKCKLLLNPDGSISSCVGAIVEHNLKEKKDSIQTRFPDSVVDGFFTFSSPIRSQEEEEGVFLTSIKPLPQRVLKLHTKNKKYYLTTDINGEVNIVILGTHVTVDIPLPHGPPLLRGITLYGSQQSYKAAASVKEEIPIGPFPKDFAKQ